MKRLKIICCLLALLSGEMAIAQTVPYGDNAANGKFVNPEWCNYLL
ncbi:MAG: hypothetical protein WC716_02260 [Chitinophagaceae bacterium]|jgi:hypothetical protein